MSQHTPIYGHSRGYRTLAILAMVAVIFSFLDFRSGYGISAIGLIGLVGFSALFFYAWFRSTRRVVVLTIEETGFAVEDPAQTFGLIEFEEIEEIRIYALLEHPMIAFRLHHPDQVRRRGPAVMRVVVKAFWPLQHYQIVVQLDEWNDQVAAIKSVAVRSGIPIRSELL
jgi:hypothetical protein